MGKKLNLYILGLILIFGCGEEIPSIKPATEDKPVTVQKIETPVFNQDSAYQFIQTQVDFGPRVPNSEAHKKCGTWLENTLTKYGAKTIVQEAVVTAFNGDKLNMKNIIAQFSPEKTNRVMLFAHWDTRPWADNDSENKNKPILGADDGASGCAVMLEIARAIEQSEIELEDIGVDFLFVDVEDVGKTEWSELSFSLGTQYWAQTPHKPAYKANYGICLDMVGAKNAQFLLEGFSKRYADDKQRNIWDIANKLGYSQYFLYQDGGAITDDHVVVNEMAKIPCVDIININESGSENEDKLMKKELS